MKTLDSNLINNTIVGARHELKIMQEAVFEMRIEI